jgi:hypothetical protein
MPFFIKKVNEDYLKMNKQTSAALLLFTLLFSQELPSDWSQSYCTYELGKVNEVNEYSIGFGVDNYCIYAPTRDTICYDQRRFDAFAKLGLFKNTEAELKYTTPTCGILSVKYQFFRKYLDASVKIGFGYMKGTRQGYITDYVFDFYPGFIFSKRLIKNINFYFAPKTIYSIHTRDRQEHSSRPPRYIFQYGWGIGFSIGDEFSFSPESNWLFGNNMGKRYTVNQFGIGVNLKIH